VTGSNITHRAVCLLVAVSACTPSMHELRSPVDADLARRLGPGLDPRAKVDLDQLLAAPLDAHAAIKIAIANSARLAAVFDELGIAGGGLGAALGLGPTEIHGAIRWGGEHREYELDVVQNVLGLIIGARRRAAGHAEVDAARAMATAETLRLAARVEIAWTDLVAAQQAVELRRTAFEAADAAATLRERMHSAGNTSDLAQARDRDAREQARIDVARAEAMIETRREALNALLGLSGPQTAWTARGQMPDLPAAAPSLDQLEVTAVGASLDLVAGRARANSAANRAADERIRAFVPELGLGVSVHDDVDGQTIGPMIQLGIPLFDWRSGERMRANATVRRAEHELTATAIELRATARSARVNALAAYQETRHLKDIVLPLRQQIVDETLKHYNAMDADPFTLVVARRELVAAGDQYLDALRRYWNAISSVTALQRGVAIELPAANDRSPRSSSSLSTDRH
jgi:outer membrane protein TolC